MKKSNDAQIPCGTNYKWRLENSGSSPRRRRERQRGRLNTDTDTDTELWSGTLRCSTSNATLKSTMDTLVLRCQHTWTVVLPRWGVCRSRDVREALRSSSDSWSTLDSSGNSGKCGKSSHLNKKTKEGGDILRLCVLYQMYHGKISLPGAAEYQVNTQGYINMVNMVYIKVP